MHIHIPFLHQGVYNQLREQAKYLDQNWRTLAEKSAGVDLTKEDPFKLLQQYVVGQGDNMANYGLALAVSPEGEMILLTNRLKLTDLNPGSAGEIQDYQCAVAGNGLYSPLLACQLIKLAG